VLQFYVSQSLVVKPSNITYIVLLYVIGGMTNEYVRELKIEEIEVRYMKFILRLFTKVEVFDLSFDLQREVDEPLNGAFVISLGSVVHQFIDENLTYLNVFSQTLRIFRFKVDRLSVIHNSNEIALCVLFFNKELNELKKCCINNIKVKISFPALRWLSLPNMCKGNINFLRYFLRFYPNVDVHWDKNALLDKNISIFETIISNAIDFNHHHALQTCTLQFHELQYSNVAEILPKWVNLKRLKLNVIKTELTLCDNLEAENLKVILTQCKNLTELQLVFMNKQYEELMSPANLDEEEELDWFYANAESINDEEFEYQRQQHNIEVMNIAAASVLNILLDVFSGCGNSITTLIILDKFRSLKDIDVEKLINCFPEVTDLHVSSNMGETKTNSYKLVGLSKLKNLHFDTFSWLYNPIPKRFLNSIIASAKNLQSMKLKCFDGLLVELDRDVVAYPKNLKEISLLFWCRIDEPSPSIQDTLCSVIHRTNLSKLSVAIVYSYRRHAAAINTNIRDLLFNSSIEFSNVSDVTFCRSVIDRPNIDTVF